LSAEPTTAGALLPPGRDERRWRRRSLWSLLVLLPLSMAALWHEDFSDFATGRDWFATEVAPGATVRYGGVDWRLDAVEAVPERAGRMRLPEQAVPVRVRFTATVRDPGINDSWLPCRIALVDQAGRRWASFGFGGLPASGDEVKSCGGATLDPHQPGDVLKIEESFVVPKALADALEPTVSIRSDRPWYLRFRRTP
jgi:hypothetical protein